MAKAVRIVGTNVLCEGALILSNGCPLDQLARIKQVAQGKQAVIKGRRSADECHAAGCNLMTVINTSAVSCPLNSDLLHKDFLLEVAVGPVAQHSSRFDR